MARRWRRRRWPRRYRTLMIQELLQPEVYWEVQVEDSAVLCLHGRGGVDAERDCEVGCLGQPVRRRALLLLLRETVDEVGCMHNLGNRKAYGISPRIIRRRSIFAKTLRAQRHSPTGLNYRYLPQSLCDGAKPQNLASTGCSSGEVPFKPLAAGSRERRDARPAPGRSNDPRVDEPKQRKGR